MDETQEGKDFYQPVSESDGVSGPTAPKAEDISWTAQEFIHHDKGASWYIMAVLTVAIVAVAGYLLTRDNITAVAIVILGVILLVVSGRKPRTFSYSVSQHGLTVGSKEYTYDEFQSFSIMQEGPIESIMLLPQKRWAPALNIYFAPDDGQKIFDTLSTFLPFEEREKDMVEKFLHKIRF